MFYCTFIASTPWKQLYFHFCLPLSFCTLSFLWATDFRRILILRKSRQNNRITARKKLWLTVSQYRGNKSTIFRHPPLIAFPISSTLNLPVVIYSSAITSAINLPRSALNLLFAEFFVNTSAIFSSDCTNKILTNPSSTYSRITW